MKIRGLMMAVSLVALAATGCTSAVDETVLPMPGAATPPHRHDCDEVILCQAGVGELHVDGQVHRFGADCTLVLPRDCPHQIFNVGAIPMEILGVFGATPVATWLPNGEALELPWRT